MYTRSVAELIGRRDQHNKYKTKEYNKRKGFRQVAKKQVSAPEQAYSAWIKGLDLEL